MTKWDFFLEYRDDPKYKKINTSSRKWGVWKMALVQQPGHLSPTLWKLEAHKAHWLHPACSCTLHTRELKANATKDVERNLSRLVLFFFSSCPFLFTEFFCIILGHSEKLLDEQNQKLKKRCDESIRNTNHISAPEAKWKSVERDLEKYRREIEQTKNHILQADHTFKTQVTCREKKGSRQLDQDSDFEEVGDSADQGGSPLETQIGKPGKTEAGWGIQEVGTNAWETQEGEPCAER